MYLVWGLFLMSLVSNRWMQLIIFVLFSWRLFNNRKLILWWLVSLVFFYIGFFGWPLVGNKFVVESIRPYRVSLRQGFNTVDIIGEHSFEVGNIVAVTGKLEREQQSDYQKIRHYKGHVKVDGVRLVKSKTLRALFTQRISSYDYVLNYFSHDSNTLFSYLSLQLSGFLLVVDLIYSFFLGNKGLRSFRVAIIVLYGVFFGWVFAVIRILLREFVDRKVQMIILLMLYPSCASYPGFYLVYGAFLMKHLHHRFSGVDEFFVRMFMLWHLLGKINAIEVLLYPVIKGLAGVISILTFCHLTFMSEFILSVLHSLDMSRFLIVGAPPLILLFLFFIFDKKQMWMVLCLVAIALNYFPIMSVSMLNVYQGDATLIQFPFGAYTILIDTGKASAYSSLKKNLHKKGVKRIDVLIITHDDHDHMGSLDRVVKDFGVLEVVVDKGIDVMGMVNIRTKTYDNDNDNSLVYYMNVLNTSFLFMGDVSHVVERDLIGLYPHLVVDVLKLGHHGSKTSTSDAFLKSLRPELGLISSDPRSYGHPAPEVMATLQNHRIVSIQTGVEGTTSLYLLPFFDIVVSEFGGFGIMKKRMMR